MSSRTTAIPTWLTGALVTARIARSASDGPRNTHTSPVRVSSTALSSASSATAARVRTGRLWKLLGVAGLAGVAAGGVVLARNERQRRAYTPDDVRTRLHERHATLAEVPAPRAVPPAGRRPRLTRLLRRR